MFTITNNTTRTLDLSDYLNGEDNPDYRTLSNYKSIFLRKASSLSLDDMWYNLPSIQTAKNLGYITIPNETQRTSQTQTNLGDISGTVSIDCTTIENFEAKIIGDTTISFTGLAAIGKSKTVILTLQNGGAHTVTFSGVKWPGGFPPVLTASGYDVLVFSTTADGSIIRMQLAQRDSK